MIRRKAKIQKNEAKPINNRNKRCKLLFHSTDNHKCGETFVLRIYILKNIFKRERFVEKKFNHNLFIIHNF